MRTYQDIQKEFEQEQTKLFEKFGVFFAFNTEQFKEGAKGEKHFSYIGLGTYLPTKNVKSFLKEYRSLQSWLELAVKYTDPEKTILYELQNHEAFYTGEIYDTMKVLADYGYTEKQVKEVYNKYLEQYA